jgi:hypothetical protein
MVAMTFLQYANPQQPPLHFRDRRTALKAVGIVQIVLGALSGCLALLYLLLLLLRRPGSAPAGELVSYMMLCAGAAAFFVWVGAGAVRIRRWVRPVMLATGWTWLAMGGLFLIFYLLSLPDVIKAAGAASSGAGAPGTAAGGVAFGDCFSFLFYVLLTGVLVAFYQWSDVRETLAHFDRDPRWTDRCPVPALALSLLLVTLAGVAAASAVARPVVPLFGAAITGLPAAAAYLALAAAMLLLARSTFKLRVIAWWTTALLFLLWAVSLVVTEIWGDLGGAYRRAGYSDDEIDTSAQGLTDVMALAWFVVFYAAAFGYLLYVRRFFVPTRARTLTAGPVPS